MKDGFVKVACATPRLRVADCAYNTSRIETMIGEAAEQGAALCREAGFRYVARYVDGKPILTAI